VPLPNVKSRPVANYRELRLPLSAGLGSKRGRSSVTISHSDTGDATGSAVRVVASPGIAAVGRVSTSACNWQVIAVKSRLARAEFAMSRDSNGGRGRRPGWRTVEIAIVIAVGAGGSGCRRCSLVPGKQTSDRVKLSKPASGERDPVGGDSSGGCNVASRMKSDVPASRYLRRRS
jgi:hypothetical protein